MVFELEIEDDDPCSFNSGTGDGHLLDSLSPVQRAWLLGAGGAATAEEQHAVTQKGATVRTESGPDGERDESTSDHHVIQNATKENDTPAARMDNDDARPPSGLNINSFSACLFCFPIAESLTSQLDQNSIYSLSRTCRQFRGTLLLFRDDLVKSTLRCEKESQEAIADGPKQFRTCARDLVSDCRRCGRIVCRNCIWKKPSDAQQPRRLRRLCPTCVKAPLSAHLDQSSASASASLGTRTAKHTSISSSTHPATQQEQPFTAIAFQRTPCTCSQSVHICQPCGSSLSSSDTIYLRCLSWRKSYGELYTGLSEGTKGVRCGKGVRCLAAQESELEVEVDASECRYSSGSDDAERSLLQIRELSLTSNGTARAWTDGGYMAQGVEGIGGAIRMKQRRKVRTGAPVDNDSFAGSGSTSLLTQQKINGIPADCAAFLRKDVNGERRSWCAWCERIVPALDDGWEG